MPTFLWASTSPQLPCPPWTRYAPITHPVHERWWPALVGLQHKVFKGLDETGLQVKWSSSWLPPAHLLSLVSLSHVFSLFSPLTWVITADHREVFLWHFALWNMWTAHYTFFPLERKAFPTFFPKRSGFKHRLFIGVLNIYPLIWAKSYGVRGYHGALNNFYAWDKLYLLMWALFVIQDRKDNVTNDRNIFHLVAIALVCGVLC